jgi:hypothetical protein
MQTRSAESRNSSAESALMGCKTGAELRHMVEQHFFLPSIRNCPADFEYVGS